jgi:hypothetical protein
VGGPTGAPRMPPAACIRQDGAPVASYVLRRTIGGGTTYPMAYGLGSYIGSYGLWPILE